MTESTITCPNCKTEIKLTESLAAPLEPRIRLEEPAKSYHAKHRVTETDSFDNRLIFGDNLPALFASEWEIA